ncbi:hypothetical protein Nepgr_006168 [Nepenthes gracilis]|uniref:C3H1-type domain-containing protein n=1 Tax=Nepenthes gracilis TaxID=150966 RepID=A0AAD3S4X1_NEPGR|nr:hypothetical protein Nepgr_006168 [Nepenthes gracilis]
MFSYKDVAISLIFAAWLPESFVTDMKKKKDVSPLDCHSNTSSSAHSSLLASKSFILSSLPETNSNSAEMENTFPNFDSLYQSLASEENMPHSPSPDSPLSSSTPYAAPADNAMANENRLYQARLIIESHLYQELLNRYGVALNCLHDLTREAQTLRKENDLLRLVNDELTHRLRSLFPQPFLQNRVLSSSPLSLIDNLRSISIGSTSMKNHHEIPHDIVCSNSSPTSVIENGKLEGNGLDRVSLPKSISVRSSGYLKKNQLGGNNNAGPSRTSNLSRLSSQPVDAARVYVKQEENALEMEVYNQGMYKTELCNKWQETGACPYGEQCQFAHGLSELCPVLRHPRYKTEVCRMVLAGVSCPYGHRCHFRHTISECERLTGPR